MGELVGKEIIQSRVYLDPDSMKVPQADYKYSYPITVYDAVRQNMDENSPTLTEEIQSIYRLINDKQNIVDSGIPGQVMTWSGVRGQIGSLEVVKAINTDATKRSNQKLATERAIGAMLDAKVDNVLFNAHIHNSSIHVTNLERNRWDQMAPLSTLQAHIANQNVHVTEAERRRWNAAAPADGLDEHISDTLTNPHNVTAHQTGTYDRDEIDDMFENLRESFFNYKNIYWDERTNTAKLDEYHPSNWNPNFVLEFGESFPEVADPSLTYFALRPVTDYTVNETQDCMIYIKQPGLSWQEVGLQPMQVGDMTIRYPDTTMCVWIQGHFMKLFIGETNEVLAGDGTSDKLWKPIYDRETGILSWVQAKADSENPPLPMIIKGEDGYTPIKGVDYDDGKDGQGVPPVGPAGGLLSKVTDEEDFNTRWVTLTDLLIVLAESGQTLPDGLVNWDSINSKPEWYNELGPNEDGFITQSAVTKQFESVNTEISKLGDRLNNEEGTTQDIHDHINDRTTNPHGITPSMIGAVSNTTYLKHATDRINNPHGVTKKDVGLEFVDNTSDRDKPLSVAAEEKFAELNNKIKALGGDVDDANYITSASWNGDTWSLEYVFKDGSELDIRIPVEDIFGNMEFDNSTGDFVIPLPDGTENRVNISSLIQTYFGSNSANIQVEVSPDTNIIKATLIPGAVGEYEIAPSVNLRGLPTVSSPDLSKDDRSAHIATTEFVRGIVIDILSSYETDKPLSANMGRLLNQRKVDVDDLIQIINDLKGLEVIDTLDSTNTMASLSANMGRYLDEVKSPRVHTSPAAATYGRSTVSLFGHARASDEDPEMDGTVFRGIDNGYYAREGHRHPTDITRAPMHWPDTEHNLVILTGEPRAETPPDNSNDTRIATTEWIRRNATGTAFGRCSTPTASRTKNVVLESSYIEDPPFMLQKGSTVVVTFAHDAISHGVDKSGNQTNNEYYLDVQNTGGYPIRYGGKIIRSEMIRAGYTYTFTFDGTFWHIENPSADQTVPDSDNSNLLVSSEWVRRNAVGVNWGTCQTTGSDPNKIAILHSSFCGDDVSFVRQMGSCVAITFMQEDTSKQENVTYLNVNNSGAAQIKYGGKALPRGYIGTNYCHMFVFDGQYWQLINPVMPGPKKSEYGTWDPDAPLTVVNQQSGFFGFTTAGDNQSNPTIDSDGKVNKVWFNITYTPRNEDVTIKFNDIDHDAGVMEGAWGALMGNGTVAVLNNPRVVDADRGGAVIEFTSDDSYPENAPCQLVYRTNKAWMKILPELV